MVSPREPAGSPLRKTPSQTRALRTVDTLFEAATRILASEGEAGFTTNRIAERAGFSIGTLYQYFPSKEAIVVALVRRHRERVMRELDVMLDRAVAGEYGAERIRCALERLGDPALPVPDAPTLYMLTRAVIGAVRSAAVEESTMLDDPRFEDALFRMVWGLLHRPAGNG